MEVQGIFPTPVGIFNLDRAVTKEELDLILNTEYHENTGNKTSLNKYVLDEPELKNINTFCLQSVKTYVDKVVCPRDDVNIFITQSWSNKTEKGEFHHQHTHANSFISGVFYVKTNEKKDRIHFYKSGYEQIKLETENYNIWNSESWWFPVKDGQLMLFPSSLSHDVPAVSNLRVSLSFNTFVQGEIGSETNATKLKYTKKHLFPL